MSQSTVVGLEAGVSLPTASRDLGSGRTDYTLNGIVSTGAAGYDIDINVGYTRLGIADAGASRTQVGWAVGTGQRGTHSTAQFLNAVSFTAAPTLVFDGGALFGLNRESPQPTREDARG